MRKSFGGRISTRTLNTRSRIVPHSLPQVKNRKYQLPNKLYGGLKKLTEPGQGLQNDFTGKLYNIKIEGDVQILIASHRFTKWPTAKLCKTFETKEVIQFLTKKVKLYGIPEKSKSDKGEPSYQKIIKNISKAEYRD